MRKVARWALSFVLFMSVWLLFTFKVVNLGLGKEVDQVVTVVCVSFVLTGLQFTFIMWKASSLLVDQLWMLLLGGYILQSSHLL